MALITCKDCNEKMSDMAAACPKCGGPNTSQMYRTLSNFQASVTRAAEYEKEKKKNSIWNRIGLTF
jgi:hypothetical protein